MSIFSLGMRSILLDAVSQHGPMGPHMYWTPNLMLITLFSLLIAFAILMILFPPLERVRATENIQPTVEIRRAGPDVEDTAARVGTGRGRAIDVALRLLEPDERRVVEALIAAGGTMLQKDISHELGFTRVKTHRVMVRLLRRGVVTAEKYYNTNRIELADWLKPDE